MKKIVLLLSAIIIAFIAQSNSKDDLYFILKNVNQQWSKQKDAQVYLNEESFNIPRNENSAIQLHLRLVVKTLSNRTSANLNIEQTKNRNTLLKELKTYADCGSFPVNHFKPYRTPVFIDDAGTHCAVGYLMMKSGHDALAQEINNKQRFAYVYEIKVNGVAEWADEFGFTIDELAWIQPAYPPTMPTYTMKEGLNGRVNCMVSDAQGQIYAGGKFTQAVNGVSCNNIALWYSGYAGWDWADVNSGVNGEVHSLLFHNNKLYAGGNFTIAGSVSVQNIAVYDIISGQWSAMGSLDSTVLSLAVYNNEIYAAGRFTGYVSKWTGTEWEALNPTFLYGSEARTLEVFGNQLIVGGDFELATGALRRNVVGYNGTYFNWEITFEGTPTPVNDFAIYKNHLYAVCDFISSTDTCALAVLDDNGWEKIMSITGSMDNFLTGDNFKTIQAYQQGLIIGGSFSMYTLMTWGSHLMQAMDLQPEDLNSLNSFSVIPLAALDSSVNSICKENDQYYFGGDFNFNNNEPLTHVAYFQITDTRINENHQTKSLQLSPNPAKGFVKVVSTNTVSHLSIYNTYGQLIQYHQQLNSDVIDISELSAGVYFLQAVVDDLVCRQKLVVK